MPETTLSSEELLRCLQPRYLLGLSFLHVQNHAICTALGFKMHEAALFAWFRASKVLKTTLFAGFRVSKVPETILFAWFRVSKVPETTLFAWFRVSKVPETTLFAGLQVSKVLETTIICMVWGGGERWGNVNGR